MSDFNMSKLYLGKDGNYRDVNGNIIALKGQPLSGAAWKYLASKYGKEYANRTSMNTRNGNIFLNGRWRFNDILSDKEGRTASWEEANSRIEENAKAAGAKKTAAGYTLRNPFNNKDTYLNQDTKDKAVGFLKSRKNEWKPQLNKESNLWDKTGEDGLLAGALESAGVDPTLALVGSMGAYFIPGVGSVLAAGDAVNSFAHGNIREGIMNTLFAIPGLGGGLKLAGLGLKGLGRTAKLVSKTPGLARTNKVGLSLIETGSKFRGLPNNPLFLRRLKRAGTVGLIAGFGLALSPLFFPNNEE